jgi:hypothetical protein
MKEKKKVNLEIPVVELKIRSGKKIVELKGEYVE